MERVRQPRPLKIKISITIDKHLLDEIRVLAEDDDRSVSQYINMAMRKYINKIKQNK